MHHLVAISNMTVKTRNSVIIYDTVGNNVKAHLQSIQLGNVTILLPNSIVYHLKYIFELIKHLIWFPYIFVSEILNQIEQYNYIKLSCKILAFVLCRCDDHHYKTKAINRTQRNNLTIFSDEFKPYITDHSYTCTNVLIYQLVYIVILTK